MARRKAKRKYGTGLTVYLPERSRVWWMRGTVRGIRVQESTRTDSEAHARQIADDRYREILDASVNNGGLPPFTFAEAVAKYLDDKKHNGHRMLDKVLDKLGSYTTSEITTSLVDDVAVRLMPGANEDSRRRHVYTPVIAVINHCHEKGKCARCEVKRPKRDKRNKKPVVWAPDEWFADLVAKVPNRAIVAYCFLLTTTGLRGIEALQLRRSDINFAQSYALLPGKTKTMGQARVVLVEEVVKMLWDICGEAGTGAKVFPYSTPDSANQVLKKACASVGIPYYSSHKLGRHSFASRILKAGKTLKELQAAGRWETINVPAEIYGHLEQGHVDDVVRGSAGKLFGRKE
jgi:integrase